MLYFLQNLETVVSKNIKATLLLLLIFFVVGGSNNVFANTLKDTCTASGNKLNHSVLITDYVGESIKGESTIRAYISKDQSATLLINQSSGGAKLIADIAKTAFLTGGRVNICYSLSTHQLWGIEWHWE